MYNIDSDINVYGMMLMKIYSMFISHYNVLHLHSLAHYTGVKKCPQPRRVFDSQFVDHTNMVSLFHSSLIKQTWCLWFTVRWSHTHRVFVSQFVDHTNNLFLETMTWSTPFSFLMNTSQHNRYCAHEVGFNNHNNISLETVVTMRITLISHTLELLIVIVRCVVWSDKIDRKFFVFVVLHCLDGHAVRGRWKGHVISVARRRRGGASRGWGLRSCWWYCFSYADRGRISS